MTLGSFVNNFLEPLAFATYLLATVVHFRRNRNAYTGLLLVYYAFVTAAMIYASLDVWYRWRGNNIWAYDAVALLTTVCLGAYFYRLFQSPAKKRNVLLLIASSLLYFLLKNTVFIQPRLFDSIGYSIVSASVAVYVFMYFHQLLKNVTEASILRDFNFWLASGYLIYFVGSFIIFLSYYYFTAKILQSYTKNERDLLTALWGVHNLLLFISALSLLVGSLWLNSRKKSAL